jgi:PAS domain S-box-containing protein
MGYITKEITKLLYIGTNHYKELDIIDNIKVSNFCNIMFSLSTLFFSLLFISIGKFLPGFGLSLLVLFFLSNLYLNKLGYSTISRIGLIVVLDVFVGGVYSIFTGIQSGAFLSFFLFIFLPFLFFEYNEKKKVIFCTVFTMLTFFSVMVYFFIFNKYTVSARIILTDILFLMHLTAVLLLITFGCLYFQAANYKSKRIIRKIQAQLKMQAAIVLYDGQGQLIDSNPLARELLGLSEDRIRGKSPLDQVWRFLREDGTIMPVAEYPVSIVLSSKRPLQGYVVGIRHPDKEDTSWVLVNAEPEYGGTGEISLVIVSFVDITERKQAAEEIAWNLAINKTLSSLYIPIVTTGTSIEQIADIVLERSRELTGSKHGYVAEIDPDNEDLIAHTNTKMMETECAIAEEELRKIRFPKREDGLYNGLWGHTLNTKEPFYDNAALKNPASVGIPEGHIMIQNFLSVPVLMADELVGQIALSNSTRDYTDRDLEAVTRIAKFFGLAIQDKRAEEEIRTLNQELEQRVHERTIQLETTNKELEAFAYSVSHDLRAPLRHIGGFIDLLKEQVGTSLDDKGSHYIEIISDSASKLGQLIDDLLSFSRMVCQEMKMQEVNLGTIAFDVMGELEAETAERNIQWHIKDLPTVRGDKSLLRIVMMNLFSNAVKFTRTQERAVIETGSEYRNGAMVIFVRDNGVGFDQKYAKDLFGVFKRLHRVDEFEGTGIGLATVQRIIQRQGGRIWAEGELDRGSTFYFSLPSSIE